MQQKGNDVLLVLETSLLTSVVFLVIFIFNTVRGELAIEKYVKLANKYKISPSTFANSFVNNRPFVTSNIIGATSMDQLKENINSININLSTEMLKEIEEIHLSDPNPCV